jgi:predicted amidohydrolase YtcJ
MESIEKKHLKRMECPKCNRPKLRFGHDGGIRCDICKVDYPESDPALQKEFQRIQSEMTPPPVATGRYYPGRERSERTRAIPGALSPVRDTCASIALTCAAEVAMKLLALVLAALAPATGVAAPADVVFKNGNIYTNDDRQPHAEALAVVDGKLVYVGSNAGLASFSAKRTIDLKGRTVVPGFVDAHAHLAGIGAREATLNLEGIESLDKLLAVVKKTAAGKKAGAWVVGRGWIETFWKPPAFPRRQDLDRAAPRHPVFLTRADGHGAVANSAALALAGIDARTPDPFGGKIVKDPSNGEPTGMLLDAAQNLVQKQLPPVTPAESERHLLLGVAREVALGWTQIHIAGNSWSEVDQLRALYRAGKIKLRIYDAIRGPGADAERLLRDGPSLGEQGGRLTVRTIKITIDGALGSRGAALLAPYSDADTSGFLTQKEDELARLFAEALRRGIQVETHAIGDRANRTILDLYEKAFQAVPPAQRKVSEPRWRVEHAQIVALEDIPRFARLGVIPSMQPSHAIGDLHFAERRLGRDRLEGAYAWRRFRDAGSVIAGGTDAPVERGEPMIEFYAAVARRDLHGFRGKGWHADQILTRAEALRALTLWPAIASFQEKERGSLEAGKVADLTVLSADVIKIPEAEIPKTRCLTTVIGGEIVFDVGDR